MLHHALIIAATLTLTTTLSGQVVPEGKERPSPAQASPEGVDELLNRLETIDEDLTSLQADVYWDRRTGLTSDQQIRQGRLYFQSRGSYPDAVKAFAVNFDTLIVDDALREVSERYVFDGAWFTEVKSEEKVFNRRRVARPGERIDPLRLGEGPFPLPIGQTRRAILDRFEATTPEIMEGLDELTEDERALFTAAIPDAVQLHLVPRQDVEDADANFEDLRIWYDRETLLPQLVRAESVRGGDISYLMLMNVRRNDFIPPTAMSVRIPDESEGWTVQISEGRFAPREDAPESDDATEGGTEQ